MTVRLTAASLDHYPPGVYRLGEILNRIAEKQKQDRERNRDRIAEYQKQYREHRNKQEIGVL
ncbi:MAG: hypothetical protein SCH66_14910 [Methanolobus sp.]|nr:hypothetical protein [Methanolobus sp.]